MAKPITLAKRPDWVLWGIIFLAALIRFSFLSIKPPHFDEGISGWWVDQIISNGFYPYDPTNYHGPFSYYLLFIFKFLMGRNIWSLRIPAVLMGIGSVYLVTRFKEILGREVAYIAAFAFALSPALIFYSRYTPHEGALLFFSLLTILGFVRFIDIGDKKSLWQIGIGLAGAACTKETFFIHSICFFLALLCLKIYDKIWRTPSSFKSKPREISRRDVVHVIFVSTLVIVILYTGFFMSLNGLINFFKSFISWFQTGTKGSGHDKPFWYWASLFLHCEWPAALGFICSLQVLFPFLNKKNREAYWLRLFAIYGLGVFVAYSIVPYKTPWCVIEILWPFYFLLGNFVASISRFGKKSKAFVYTLVSICFLASGYQAIDLNFFNYTNETEPYVYVQTYKPFMGIDSKVQQLLSESANNYHMPVKVFLVDVWPIPWMWAEMTHVGYFGNQIIPDVDADLVLADLSKRDYMESHFKKKYFFQIFTLRAAQPESIAYFEIEKFKKFFPAGTPVFTPKLQSKPEGDKK